MMMTDERKTIFNKLEVLLGLNRKESKSRLDAGTVMPFRHEPIQIFDGIYGDHDYKVLATRRAKNKVAKASRKRNRR